MNVDLEQFEKDIEEHINSLTEEEFNKLFPPYTFEDAKKEMKDYCDDIRDIIDEWEGDDKQVLINMVMEALKPR